MKEGEAAGGFNGGERGIRTPGTLRLRSFQDFRNRPLCHLSVSLTDCRVRFFRAGRSCPAFSPGGCLRGCRQSSGWQLRRVGATEHLLVDGSNVIHAWPELRALIKREKAVARERLIGSLLVLLPAEFARVTVVFDGRGSELVVEHPAGPDSLAVIYTPGGATADDVIEQLVGRATEPAACVVATGDQAERATIEATGAAWCSPEDLK